MENSSHPVTEWSYPPYELKLTSGEVHIWLSRLDRESEELEELGSLLSIEEQKRANRFLRPQDRDYFVAGRGRVRRILGLYTGEEPKGLEFRYNPYGKLSLKGSYPFYFNLSHSKNLLLFGITGLGEVGIDIEFIRPNLNYMKLAERYFSPEEWEELRSLPPSLKALGFFNGWSRKEAYIKARGKGLAIALCSFSTSLDPRKVPQILRVEEGMAEDWTLHSFQAARDFAAAVVVKSGNPFYRYWRSPEDL